MNPARIARIFEYVASEKILQALLEGRLSRLLWEKGSVAILKNNAPKYVIISYDQIAADEQVSDEQLFAVSKKSLKRHEAAYKELATWSASQPSKLCSSMHTSLKYRVAQRVWEIKLLWNRYSVCLSKRLAGKICIPDK